jgi:colanic acid/amylovoran biosynthesis protein
MELASGMSARWIGEFQLDDPPGLQVIPQTGRCRVVVTGSYHAAVFALGQGIPAVCMEHSPYYSQKFRGLQAQFGAGVEIVPMAEPDFGLRLERAIRFAWDSAERLRVSLLDATAAQIDLSRAAYARFFSGLGKGGTGTP